MGSDPLASFVDSACGIKQDSQQENIFSIYRFRVSFAVLTALFLPVTSTTSLRLQVRQEAICCDHSGQHARARDRSMGVVGGAARASIHGAMDSSRVAPCSLSC